MVMSSSTSRATHSAGAGLEYLWGVTYVEAGEEHFVPFWGRDRAREKRAFEAVHRLRDRAARTLPRYARLSLRAV